MKLLILLTIGMLVFSCEKPLFRDDELSLPKENYLGSKLMIEGYYYLEYGPFEGDNTIYRRNYFFYRNGVVLSGGTTELSNLTEKEQSYMDGTYYSSAQDTKYDWGIFIVEGSSIKFEKWYPSSGGPLRTAVREGTILNDTTFHITVSYRMQDGDKQDVAERDETYHFKALTPKPDSTNEYTN